jgi:hypothetical protein
MTEVTVNAPESAPVGTPIEERISNPIDTGKGDEANLRAATEALRKQRQKDWESGVGGDDVFAEQNAPLQELKYRPGHGEKSLRAVTKDVSDLHRMERSDARFAVEVLGGDPELVRQRAQDPAFGEAMGLSPGDAERWSRTGEFPAKKPLLAAPHGAREPIPDNLAINKLPDREALNVRQATSEMKAGREFEAAELTRQELARQEAEALALEQQAAVERVEPQPQPQPAEQAQQPRPDPLAAERQRLAFEAQALAALRQSSVEETRAIAMGEQILQGIPKSAIRRCVKIPTNATPPDTPR